MLALPFDCNVNFDLAIIDLLKHLNGLSLDDDYAALQGLYGCRLTLAEF